MTMRRQINGWKAIGAHFQRDRSTVIRWARDRGMPVHRVPGGPSGSVYAFRDELDRWSAADRASDTPTPVPDIYAEAPAPVDPPPSPAPARRRRWLPVAAAILLVGGPVALTSTMFFARGAQSPDTGLPRDRAVADRYLEARDLVASRDGAKLARAIVLLREVTARDQGFAPGYADLAEALILSREFGSTADATAFEEARVAARTAIRLDPASVGGNRAIGFIAYWRDGDMAIARDAFHRAIALAADDPLTHFWFANALADNGEAAAATRSFDIARLRMAGSGTLRVDLAWAEWSRGAPAADRAIADLAGELAGLATAQDCLAIARLAGNDLDGYVAARTRFANLRGDGDLVAEADLLRRARASGPAALRRVILQRALAASARDGASTHVWPAFVASMANDRTAVLAALRLADQRREAWGEAGLVRRIAARWRDDATITALLAARHRAAIA